MMNYRKFIRLLKEELLKPLPGSESQNLMAPEGRRILNEEFPERKAAVLLLVYPQNGEIMIVFIKRKDYEGPHGGQISFPGGMYENSDNDLSITALRETEEETGISREDIRLIGELSSLHIPVSNINVHPFVGYLCQEPVFHPDPAEVDFMITSAVKTFTEAACRKKEKWNLSGEPVEVPFYSINNHIIWGATAMMLSEFLEIMARSGLSHCFDYN